MTNIYYVTTEELEAKVAHTLIRYPHFADVRADCSGCAEIAAMEGDWSRTRLAAWADYEEACFLLGRPAYFEGDL